MSFDPLDSYLVNQTNQIDINWAAKLGKYADFLVMRCRMQFLVIDLNKTTNLLEEVKSSKGKCVKNSADYQGTNTVSEGILITFHQYKSHYCVW